VPREPIVTSVPEGAARGRAYGVDVYVSRDAASASTRLTGWLAYTYGVATRDVYRARYPFEYDRRHSASVVARTRVGAKWELGTTVRVASGFPTTPAVSVQVAAEPDAADGDADGDTGELVPQYDSENRLVYQADLGGVRDWLRGRLPFFARVDVRASFKPRGRSGRLELYLDVINVLGRNNAEILRPRLVHDPDADRPRIQEEGMGSLGRLPSVGARFRF
jgi:hypothetical protein